MGVDPFEFPVMVMVMRVGLGLGFMWIASLGIGKILASAVSLLRISHEY